MVKSTERRRAADGCGDAAGQRRRRRDQRADVDLRSGAENDAVRVDDEDLAGSVDRTEDLAGIGARIGNDVECDPVAGVAAAVCHLIECQRRRGAHIEGLPGEQRLRLRLRDGDLGLAAGAAGGRRLHRRVGADPKRRTRRRARRRHQPAADQPIRHRGRRRGSGGQGGGLHGGGLPDRGGHPAEIGDRLGDLRLRIGRDAGAECGACAGRRACGGAADLGTQPEPLRAEKRRVARERRCSGNRQRREAHACKQQRSPGRPGCVATLASGHIRRSPRVPLDAGRKHLHVTRRLTRFYTSRTARGAEATKFTVPSWLRSSDQRLRQKRNRRPLARPPARRRLTAAASVQRPV